MKKGFIRTPSEIYDLDDLYVCEELNGKPYGVKGSGFCIYKESIIKTADTIEELCDEFVCQENDNFYWLASRENVSFRDLPNCYCKAIFGAIWTNKGLIYVAKMNEKGELELL